MSERIPGFATLAIHAGAQPDPTTGARATPIYQTTSYVFEDVDHAASLFGLQTFGNIYTRIGNPTTAVLEERVAALEGGTAGLAAASGHAAQVLAFHCLLQPGDEFVASKKLYGGSINQFTHAFKNFGWNVVWADPDDIASFERAISPKTKAIFTELIANPGGVITDMAAVAQIARRAGVPLHRRQHAGDALPVQADRSRRRHRHSFADQISRRPRQLDRRPDRRRRHLQLVARAPLSDAVRAAAGISRHRAARDLRQFRLRHRLPRAGAARHRPGAVAVQRLPHPHRHRDVAAAHARALRQHARGRRMACGASEGRLGQLSGPARRPLSQPRQEILPERRRRGVHLRTAAAATRPASSSSPRCSCSRIWPISATPVR